MSFLKRLFGSKQPSTSGPARRLNLCMIALRSSIPVSVERAHSYLQSTWPQFPQSGLLDASAEGGTLPIVGGTIMFAYMPNPIPWGDLEWPSQTAWQWSDAAEALRDHQAHVIVVASSEELGAVPLTLALTQAVAATVAVSDAAGVYYGHGSLVIEPEQYVSQAIEGTLEDLPIFLWVGFHPVPGEKGVSAFTIGMEQFGHLELEAHDSQLAPSALLGRLADAANYQLSTGRRLEDGHTFGSSAEERLAVRHAPSRYLRGFRTCQLAL